MRIISTFQALSSTFPLDSYRNVTLGTISLEKEPPHFFPRNGDYNQGIPIVKTKKINPIKTQGVFIGIPPLEFKGFPQKIPWFFCGLNIGVPKRKPRFLLGI